MGDLVDCTQCQTKRMWAPTGTDICPQCGAYGCLTWTEPELSDGEPDRGRPFFHLSQRSALDPEFMEAEEPGLHLIAAEQQNDGRWALVYKDGQGHWATLWMKDAKVETEQYGPPGTVVMSSQQDLVPEDVRTAADHAAEAWARELQAFKDLPRGFRACVQAQAWSGDYAIPVDAPGATIWDATPDILHLPPHTRRHLLESVQDGDAWLDADDQLARLPGAPDWLQSWPGPFTITVELAPAPTSPDELEDPPVRAHGGV